MARKYGLQDLLPPSKKDAEAKLARRVALGFRGKGTGVGEKVKGHKHERMLGAKYVILLDGGLVPLERWHLGRLNNANYVMQNGPEERSHAQDAGAYQGMEVGKSEVAFLLVQHFANRMYRSDGRTGQNGPNEGLHCQYRPPSAVHIHTKYGHKLIASMSCFCESASGRMFLCCSLDDA